ncbi:MAG: hypothetical protein ACSHX5_05520 [Phycisphaerales bacterium]
MKKIFLLLSSLFVLAIVAAGVWVYMSFLYTKPLTQQELQDLTPDWSKITHGNWSPWYTDPYDPTATKQWNPTASFNDWVDSIPEEQKAWPVLVDVNYAYYDQLRSEGAGSSPLEPKEWAIMIELLDQPELQTAINRLVEAFTRPYLGCPLLHSTDDYAHASMLLHGHEDDDWNPNPIVNPDLFNTLLPALGAHRIAINVVCSSAMNQLEQGNTDAFIQQITATLRSADLSLEFPVLISQLVGTAIEAKVYETILWALEYHPEKFTDTHLSHLANEIGDKSTEAYVWEAEALTGHDAFRRLADANGQLSFTGIASFSSAEATPSSLPETALEDSLQRALWIYNSVIKPLENTSSLWPSDTSLASTAPEEFVAQQLNTLDVRLRPVVELLVPYIDKAASRHRMIIQESLAMQLTIAVHRYKLRHGQFPDSIDAIDQDLLGVDPVDIMTGDPLKYRLTDAGPVIYSVGDDRIDDLGEPRWHFKDVSIYGEPEHLIRVYQYPELVSEKVAARQLTDDPESISGDWVFFPVPQDDPEPVFEDEP